MAMTPHPVAQRGGRSTSLLATALAAAVLVTGCKKEEPIRADTDFYKKIQEQLIRAKPGTV
ncbi:hypothetical protein, partial [Hyalangium sp.]|uniref:hypothetical protein n=1 Tax=Hyalangium sp. TaxID=2028555 RepID=UPI002D647589